MATFPDLRTLDHFNKAAEAGANEITLPIRGHEYTWKSSDLTVRAMLQLQDLDRQGRAIAAKIAAGEQPDPTETVLTDAEEKQLGADLIGQANLDQMAADGVLWAEVQHVVMVLMAWHLHGEQTARALWEGTL